MRKPNPMGRGRNRVPKMSAKGTLCQGLQWGTKGGVARVLPVLVKTSPGMQAAAKGKSRTVG
jgi:hypothetical protein